MEKSKRFCATRLRSDISILSEQYFVSYLYNMKFLMPMKAEYIESEIAYRVCRLEPQGEVPGMGRGPGKTAVIATR